MAAAGVAMTSEIPPFPKTGCMAILLPCDSETKDSFGDGVTFLNLDFLGILCFLKKLVHEKLGLIDTALLAHFLSIELLISNKFRVSYSYI